ncbi:hypothetical protein GCM10011321_35190 [Youhaiella tibetensis]|uniref:DUF2214 family protein n=1 Tax=Paradevosia tibetensis TaxID=1447062 RepID=A0A5B9DUD2_9HYPH|nr:DUF2214 family protein [Youhaiella tibetensis]QEE22525.1 DUF2214 family protein [Youhaiella tibetensis]GGF41516.1 hypothetical protein GCM10011321_35190 [Youhaiella tibetensis]
MLDLVLAIAHHLAVFSLVGVFAAEFFLLREGVTGPRLAQLGGIDRLYGLLAMLVIVVGVVRVTFGAAGPWYYLGNQMFWAKMTTFVVVGILSVWPTRDIMAWIKSAKADPQFSPGPAAIARARKFLAVEAVLFAFIPAFAAAMARGYGS